MTNPIGLGEITALPRCLSLLYHALDLFHGDRRLGALGPAQRYHTEDTIQIVDRRSHPLRIVGAHLSGIDCRVAALDQVEQRGQAGGRVDVFREGGPDPVAGLGDSDRDLIRSPAPFYPVEPDEEIDDTPQ